jgi:uncharacterized lipoprotein YajG
MTMKFRALGCLAACLLLAGCQSEKPATGKVLAEIQAQCQAYGFQPGTDVFAACVYQSDQNRIAGNRNRRMAAAMMLQQTGQQMQQNAQNQQMINAMNRPRTCTTTGFGNTLRTTCY